MTSQSHAGIGAKTEHLLILSVLITGQLWENVHPDLTCITNKQSDSNGLTLRVSEVKSIQLGLGSVVHPVPSTIVRLRPEGVSAQLAISFLCGRAKELQDTLQRISHHGPAERKVCPLKDHFRLIHNPHIKVAAATHATPIMVSCLTMSLLPHRYSTHYLLKPRFHQPLQPHSTSLPLVPPCPPVIIMPSLIRWTLKVRRSKSTGTILTILGSLD